MATLANQTEYLADSLDFAKEMRENGREASFGVRGAGVKEWQSGGYVETGKSWIFPSEWTRDFSADVRADDQMYFCGASLAIEECTIMVDGGVEYSIEKVKSFDPDGVVIYYEIQVRV